MNNDPLIEELRKHQIPKNFLEEAARIVRERMEKEEFSDTREDAIKYVLGFIKKPACRR